MSDTKKVSFNGREIEIKKMPLRRFAEFADELDIFIKGVRLVKLSWWRKMFPAKWVYGEAGELGPLAEQVIYGLRNYPTKVARLVSIATGLTESEILEGSFDDVCALTVAFWEHNNLISVFKDTLGKLTRRV